MGPWWPGCGGGGGGFGAVSVRGEPEVRALEGARDCFYGSGATALRLPERPQRRFFFFEFFEGLPVRRAPRFACSVSAALYSSRCSFSPGASARERKKYARRDPTKPMARR